MYFLNYDWPGNVRELEGAIVFGIITSDGKYIKKNNIPERILTNYRSNNFRRFKTFNSIAKR